jgi:hypothetical protein
MIMRLRCLPGLGVFLCVVLVTAFAAKVKTESDKTADFSSFKTYAWGKNAEPQRKAAGIVILGAVNETLKKKGLAESDVNAAQLIVRYQAAADTDLNFGSSGDPLYAQIGGAPLPDSTVWSSGFGGASSGRYVRKGTLVVDIFDKQNHKLIWSSTASGVMSNSPEKAIDQITKAVTKMFEKYPEVKE